MDEIATAVSGATGHAALVISTGGTGLGPRDVTPQTLRGLLDYEIRIPETIDMFTPIVASVPLQLLAYYIAVQRGANVDQPRNLAKSVTVE
jgi:fructoselysine-6-P-deglycase FrlB-like protein